MLKLPYYAVSQRGSGTLLALFASEQDASAYALLDPHNRIVHVIVPMHPDQVR